MQKARQVLLQVGSIILCVNGALWLMSNLRDAPITFGQLMFRISMFLLGLLLVAGAGVLALIEKLQAPVEPPPKPEPQMIDESDLIVEEPTEKEEKTE
jgi:hypothetical protein